VSESLVVVLRSGSSTSFGVGHCQCDYVPCTLLWELLCCRVKGIQPVSKIICGPLLRAPDGNPVLTLPHFHGPVTKQLQNYFSSFSS
jgi:hypothetical protein